MKTPAKLLIMVLAAAMIIFALGGCAGSIGPQGAAGPTGISVTDAAVNSDGHLILTLSNGQTIDAGDVAGSSASAVPTFSDVILKVEPTIVRIDVTTARGLASGSGTIIDKRGYIITNAHVVNNQQSIKVTLKDGTELPATVIGSDTTLDLAVIKLTSTQTDYPVMMLGTMADVIVGEDVMAAGFPMGTALPGPATFTGGIVSAIRPNSGTNYIQTDTAVNPGNSGGCLFTLSGKMIGIPTAGLVPANQDFEDINIAIPISQISTFIAQYVK